uniref:Pollen allergen CJP-8 n=1 Tax=Cryptomeria japonica TaxID=3369 RepID=D4QD83_CRYJA|nr:pollen allergen CJP-8 [Cryptomeria japonica]
MAMRMKSSSMSSYRFSYCQMMLVLMVMTLVQIGAAQSDTNSCVNSLVPCASYLNATTKPPDSCCVPLLNVIQTQQQCLCNLLNSSIVKQSSINITQALNIPRLCGDTNVSTDACSTNATANAPSASTTPSVPADTGDSSGIGATSLQIFLPLLAVFFLGVFKSFP